MVGGPAALGTFRRQLSTRCSYRSNATRFLTALHVLSVFGLLLAGLSADSFELRQRVRVQGGGGVGRLLRGTGLCVGRPGQCRQGRHECSPVHPILRLNCGDGRWRSTRRWYDGGPPACRCIDLWQLRPGESGPLLVASPWGYALQDRQTVRLL